MWSTGNGPLAASVEKFKAVITFKDDSAEETWHGKAMLTASDDRIVGEVNEYGLVERECGAAAVEGTVGGTVPDRDRRLRKTSNEFLHISESQSCCSRISRTRAIPEL